MQCVCLPSICGLIDYIYYDIFYKKEYKESNSNQLGSHDDVHLLMKSKQQE